MENQQIKQAEIAVKFFEAENELEYRKQFISWKMWLNVLQKKNIRTFQKWQVCNCVIILRKGWTVCVCAKAML